MENKYIVKNGRELADYLENVTNGAFEKDSMAYIMGRPVGTYKGGKLLITFKPCSWLLISATTSAIRELLPHLKDVMGGVAPICEYDLLYSTGSMLSTIEWDLEDPEDRLKDIVNGKAYQSEMAVNINLYNREISDYNEDEASYQKRIREAKIQGKYPGNLIAKEEIDSLEEWELFALIEKLGYERSLYMKMNRKLTDKIKYNELEFTLQYCVRQTHQYGTDVSEPAYKKEITVGEKYRLWYEKWAKFYNMETFEDKKKEFIDVLEKMFSRIKDPELQSNFGDIVNNLYGKPEEEKNKSKVKTPKKYIN